MKKFTTILVIFLLLLATMPASVMAAVVEPAIITDTLNAGDTEHDIITVALPGGGSPKGDVIFVFDATGSMYGQIYAMQVKANAIMTDVRASVPDTNFGVGSIVDYPYYYDNALNDGYATTYGSGSDYAWMTDQDLTSDTTAVQTAINGLSAGGGADGPQDYTRALYESKEAFSWRSDAKKFVVIFGDNMPHSYPSGASLGWSTYGGDPGRDEIMNTADDLDFVPVVQSLAASNIIVISGDCSGGWATPFYQYIADETGGLRFDWTTDADEMADAITGFITGASTEPVKSLTLQARDVPADWIVGIDPANHFTVPWGETRTFAVDITAPEDACGRYTLYLDVYGDGVLLGTTTVQKTVPGDCETPAPEFPTLALPGAMILGILSVVYSIRLKKED